MTAELSGRRLGCGSDSALASEGPCVLFRGCGGCLPIPTREGIPVFLHTSRLQFESKPDKPDPVYAHKLQELIGGAYGEMTVTMQYLFQGWNCRMAGKYKDLIMDIATEEIGHVEMTATMVARLLEGAPATAATKAAAADPVVGNTPSMPRRSGTCPTARTAKTAAGPPARSPMASTSSATWPSLSRSATRPRSRRRTRSCTPPTTARWASPAAPPWAPKPASPGRSGTRSPSPRAGPPPHGGRGGPAPCPGYHPAGKLSARHVSCPRKSWRPGCFFNAEPAVAGRLTDQPG
jgi:Manganese containing catalase